MGKKSSSRRFLAHPAGGQETTFYLRVALLAMQSCVIEPEGLSETNGTTPKPNKSMRGTKGPM